MDFETELLAYAADRLTQVLWWLHNDTSKPPSVLADLCGEADSRDTSEENPEQGCLFVRSRFQRSCP